MVGKNVVVTGGSGFIGIHLVDLLRRQNYKIMNLDIAPPIDGRNLDLWTHASVTDRELLLNLVRGCDPTFIIHLSATTTQNAKSLDEFVVNIEGTKNLILAANCLTNLKKLIFASTQYVNTPGNPDHQRIAMKILGRPLNIVDLMAGKFLAKIRAVMRLRYSFLGKEIENLEI
jgi:nucleoside-diphosphate-sugar epimerase